MPASLKHRLLRGIGHQHWLRGRDRVLRAFSDPDHQSSYPFEKDFFGLNYSGNLQNFIDWTVFYYGSFQEHELRLLGDLADGLRQPGKPVNFFDVGANIGHHSLFMSTKAQRVFCFEPYFVVRDELTRKLKHAHVDNVQVFPVALGDSNESHVFHPPTGSNQGTGTLSDELPSNAASETISVNVVRGDDFLAEMSLPPVSLLKMDVEGFEAEALRGLAETLRRDRPPILMEIHVEDEPHQSAAREASVLDLLYPDYRLYEIADLRGQYLLRSYSKRTREEVLVLPAELAGIVPGTS